MSWWGERGSQNVPRAFLACKVQAAEMAANASSRVCLAIEEVKAPADQVQIFYLQDFVQWLAKSASPKHSLTLALTNSLTEPSQAHIGV